MKFIEISGFRGARVNKITAKAKSQQISPKKESLEVLSGVKCLFFTIVHIRISAIDTMEGTGDTSSKPVSSETEKKKASSGKMI